MMTQTAPSPSKTYWASWEKDDLLPKLEEQVNACQRGLRTNFQYWRVRRNLRMAHGLWWQGSSDQMHFELKQLENGHVGAAVPLFRTYLQQQHAMATGDKISFKVRAENTNSDVAALARLGTSVVEDIVVHKKGIKYLKDTAWNAQLMNSAFLYVPWNPAKGGEVVPAEETEGGTPLPAVMEGDFEHHCLTPLDLTFDFSVRDWGNVKWIVTRTPHNRYDLAALFPEETEAILASVREKALEYNFWWNLWPPYSSSDLIYRFDFYHLPTPALPKGRHLAFLKGTVLLDEELPYRSPNGEAWFPVFRCAQGEFALSPMGYSNANDLQSMQEVTNGLMSSIVTNMSANGVGHILMPDGAGRLRAQALEGGLKVLAYPPGNKPEPMNFTAIDPNHWKGLDWATAAMEKMSGANAAKLGNPEANLRSAKSIQVTIAQAYQAVSEFAQSYRDMAEEYATHLVRTIWLFGKGRRRMIVGKENEQFLDDYDPEELGAIDRVIVEALDPVANSYPGRVAEATDALQFNLVKDFQQYQTVKDTGNLENLFKSEQAQIRKIQAENEDLLAMKPVQVHPVDDDRLHLLEHRALFAKIPHTQGEQQRQQWVLAHMMGHVKAILTDGQDPMIGALKKILGQIVMDPAAPPAGAPPPGTARPSPPNEGPPPPDAGGPAPLTPGPTPPPIGGQGAPQ